jgi:hypothetical protein
MSLSVLENVEMSLSILEIVENEFIYVRNCRNYRNYFNLL